MLQAFRYRADLHNSSSRLAPKSALMGQEFPYRLSHAAEDARLILSYFWGVLISVFVNLRTLRICQAPCQVIYRPVVARGGYPAEIKARFQHCLWEGVATRRGRAECVRYALKGAYGNESVLFFCRVEGRQGYSSSWRLAITAASIFSLNRRTCSYASLSG